MEQHEILDAMHATMARSYLDLEIVLEDLILIRIVAFCMVTLFAFAALPSVFQTEDFLRASLLRAHQHAAALHAG